MNSFFTCRTYGVAVDKAEQCALVWEEPEPGERTIPIALSLSDVSGIQVNPDLAMSFLRKLGFPVKDETTVKRVMMFPKPVNHWHEDGPGARLSRLPSVPCGECGKLDGCDLCPLVDGADLQVRFYKGEDADADSGAMYLWLGSKVSN